MVVTRNEFVSKRISLMVHLSFEQSTGMAVHMAVCLVYVRQERMIEGLDYGQRLFLL